MFKEELIIAGFGGQGVLSMGKILAYSGVVQGLEVTWMPSYGPEMRGGTANVTVILSDERISSPIAHDYDTAVILNQQSMDKFEPGFQHDDSGRLSEGSAGRHARKRVRGTGQIVARTDGSAVACQRSGHASRDGDYPARYGLTIAESSCCGKRCRSIRKIGSSFNLCDLGENPVIYFVVPALAFPRFPVPRHQVFSSGWT